MAVVHVKNKHLSRPRKSDAEHQRRIKVWRRRLVKLGLSEAEVAKLHPLQVRKLLQRPADIKKAKS